MPIAMVLLGAPGCATTVPAHSMSVSQHESAGSKEDKAADEHARSYNPNGGGPAMTCSADDPACWGSLGNPTEDELREAETHHKLAAAHRAASKELRDAEAKSCANIREYDRDVSPFAHRQDIMKVEPASHGATITFRAVRGMTPEYMQRLVNCHVARNAALGHDVPWMSYCPLVPDKITTQVQMVGSWLTVTIQSKDPAVAQEVLKRTQALMPPRSASQ